MKKQLLALLILIVSLSARAQIRFNIGPPVVSAATQNEQQMDRLIAKSYRMTYYYTDSIADTILIHDVVLTDADQQYYCIFYKDDTAKVAVAIEKLNAGKGYEITTFWKNRGVNRYAYYDKNYKLQGKWTEYYQNGQMKLNGHYKNGKRNGKWKYYSDTGDKTRKEKYKNGTLVKSKQKRG